MKQPEKITYKIARMALHRFEEPCISGDRGSGTIFFSGCNLRCAFCQNHEISALGKGLEVDEDKLIYGMQKLEAEGAHNINLVTPTMHVNKLIHTLQRAKKAVKVPIVWNSSGYETVANLKKLEGLVDVYLPDFKYSDDSLAFEYSHAKNYFEIACAAVREMRRQQPADVFEDGMMQKGVIVRHLVLPNAVDNARGVFEEIAKIDKSMYVSVMGQYFPTAQVAGHPVLGRRLEEGEYDRAIRAFFHAGLTNGFSQELDSATEEYVPSFDLSLLEEFLELQKGARTRD